MIMFSVIVFERIVVKRGNIIFVCVVARVFQVDFHSLFLFGLVGLYYFYFFIQVVFVIVVVNVKVYVLIIIDVFYLRVVIQLG